MKRVLYVTTQDKFFLSHIKERAIYAIENGFDVYVAAQKTSDLYEKAITDLGIHFFDTGIERQSLEPLKELRAIYKLWSIYQSIKPDIIHHLGAKAIIYGTLAQKLSKTDSNVPIINAPIGLGYVYASSDKKAKLLKPMVEIMYRLTLNPKNSEVIFENPDDLNYFVNLGILNRQKAHCVYGAGVDTSVYVPSLKNRTFTVVMTARLIKEKGVLDFISAANMLKAENARIRMQLVGEPDYGNPSSLTKEQYELVKKSQSVECLGYRENISEILGKAHVCCLPSYYREGLPRSLIEGASCGLAIVTTNTVGCREVVTNDNGFLIEPKNVQQLVNSIKFLANNLDICEQMGRRSRILAEKKFDTKIICADTLRIYQNLLF